MAPVSRSDTTRSQQHGNSQFALGNVSLNRSSQRTGRLGHPDQHTSKTYPEESAFGDSLKQYERNTYTNTSSEGVSRKPNENAPPPWSTSSNPPWPTATRPLSDIKEITEPSLIEASNAVARKTSMSRKNSTTRKDSHGRNGSVSRKISLTRKLSAHDLLKPPPKSSSGHLSIRGRIEMPPLQSPESRTDDESSAYSVSLENVPRRVHPKQPRDTSQQRMSQLRERDLPTIPQRGLGYSIPNRGKSHSPVKEMLSRLDAGTAEHVRRVPSRTFVRSQDPNGDVLEFPTHRHPRISVELHVGSSLFVGGGSIEGHARIVVDESERIRQKRQLAISRISIDLLGVEEVSGPRRAIFLNLATELIDSDHPPPHTMVDSLKQLSPLDPFWQLVASVSNLPFMLSLPLDVGPPPFHSKHARIRYVLGVTLLVRDSGKQYLVRSSQEISVLSVYDPEKALMSLPSPLTASDEYIRHRDSGVQTIKVTAGLHRQVWVSGTSIFVDVHIVNKSSKTVKRIELQLERDILCYKHAAAATLERSASQARIFDFNERGILNKSVLKASSASGWTGVPNHCSGIRTFDLELPRSHATVKCGKFFEVRYFLNVIVGTSTKPRLITVQLPIVLIHINSLDVVPNSVAQVAAAIEEKRAIARHEDHPAISAPASCVDNLVISMSSSAAPQTSTGSPRMGRSRSSAHAKVQGRAFSAPRKQSLDRMRAEQEDWAALGKLLDKSPRKYCYSPPRQPSTLNASVAAATAGSYQARGGALPLRPQKSQPQFNLHKFRMHYQQGTELERSHNHANAQESALAQPSSHFPQPPAHLPPPPPAPNFAPSAMHSAHSLQPLPPPPPPPFADNQAQHYAFRTPPSNRKGRVLPDSAQEEEPPLLRMEASDLARSTGSLAKGHSLASLRGKGGGGGLREVEETSGRKGFEDRAREGRSGLATAFGTGDGNGGGLALGDGVGTRYTQFRRMRARVKGGGGGALPDRSRERRRDVEGREKENWI